jgi:diacylglycerol kinase family enzyme
VKRRRVLVVINPSSCDFEAQRRYPELEPILKELAEVEVQETDPEDSATLVAIGRALETKRFDRVVAIGGDGTAHLVLNAMMQLGRSRLPQLGVIAFGTANNVAKSLELPLDDLGRMARIAAGDRLGTLDVARIRSSHNDLVSERYWINCVTVGMDADVLSARSAYRDLGGYLAYAAAIAERAVEQHSFDVRIKIDGEVIDSRVFNAVITNVPIYAGEIAMPGAKRDDGLLDLYLFNRQEYASKLMSFIIKQADILRLGVSEILEEITQNQRSHHGKSIKLRLATPHRVQADGEILPEADTLECDLAGRVEVAVP